jgi:hypothetical protein
MTVTSVFRSLDRVSACAAILLAWGCQKTLPVVSDDASANTAPAGSAAKGSGAAGSMAKASGNVKPGAVHHASATLKPIGGGVVSGSVSFDDSNGLIGYKATIEHCTPGTSQDRSSYPIAIFDATSCSNPAALEEWDRNHNNVVDCDSSGSGDYFEVVEKEDEVWTIGGPAESNIVGRAVGIETLDAHGDFTVIACGVIAADSTK